MSVKTKVYNIAKQNKVFRKIARNLKSLFLSVIYFLSLPVCKIENNKVYFNTFGGRSYSDSPKAIYEKMLADDRFLNFEFVWSFFEPEKYKYLEDNKNTKVVKAGSKIENQELRKSKYWITNYKMLDYQKPAKNQIYVQCWHGTPLKRLGYDIQSTDNAMNSIEEIREKYKTDAQRFRYLLSPSAFATERFITAWNLKEFGRADTIIEEGYPRNDRLINVTDNQIEEIKKKLNIEQTDKKIILYAPTWRDNQHRSGLGYTYKTEVDFEFLRKNLEENYIILFRAHYLIANEFDFDKYRGFIYNVSDWNDINDLYIAADVLITDYSSTMFDYSNLKRPMIFYMYDLEDYRDKLRGFYLSLDELPGPVVEEESSLVDAINNLDNCSLNNKYADFNDKYNYLDDGHVTERVINKIFSDISL